MDSEQATFCQARWSLCFDAMGGGTSGIGGRAVEGDDRRRYRCSQLL